MSFSCPLVVLQRMLGPVVLFDENFPHASVAVLHDVDALGGSVQPLAIGCMARDFLDIFVHNAVVHLRYIIFHNVFEVAPTISQPVVLICSSRNIQDAFFLIYTFKEGAFRTYRCFPSNRNGLESGATTKCRLACRCDARGNGQACQAAATTKGRFAYPYDARGNGNACQSGAKEVSIIS